MISIRIPQTVLNVSPLCFGVAGFGTSIRDADADRLLASFVEAGGTFVDTAHVYAAWVPDGAGASERELGNCLRRLGLGKRVVVATKGGHPTFGTEYPRPADWLSPGRIHADIDESLERLGLESVAVYYLHRDDGHTPVEEIIDALNEEITKGRVGCLGASNWSTARIAAANAYADRTGRRGFVLSQVQWSLAEPNWRPTPDPTVRFVTREETAFHSSTGIPLVCYSATANGYFAGKGVDSGGFANDANRARLERTRGMAADLGCTPTQVALAWLRGQSFPVFPLFSTSRPEHLDEALGSLAVTLEAEQIRWLHDGSEIAAAE